MFLWINRKSIIFNYASLPINTINHNGLIVSNLTIGSNSFQDVREKVCKLKKVRIDFLAAGTGPQTFNNGDVYLYEIIEEFSNILQEYVVGDDSNEFSQHFAICQCFTVVTESKIIIKWHNRFLTITVDENPFEFYKRFFSLDDFPVSIDFHRISGV